MQTKRYFNTSGPNIPAEHYTLMRKELIAKGIELVHGSRYFTIWAPRQSGKSTYFRLLGAELEKEGYKICYINFENYVEQPLHIFLNRLVRHFKEQCELDFSGESFGGNSGKNRVS